MGCDGSTLLAGILFLRKSLIGGLLLGIAEAFVPAEYSGYRGSSVTVMQIINLK
jgi:hypothetical protein